MLVEDPETREVSERAAANVPRGGLHTVVHITQQDTPRSLLSTTEIAD